MAKREFVQLAHVYKPAKHKVRNWFVSEKLDGMRTYWDGGITRGLVASDVPWANVTKDARYTETIYSTGLWTRYGKTIQAPNWFLDKLPNHPCDGELWAGRGMFQFVMSTTKQLVPDDRWAKIQYKIFDVPTYQQIFEDGEIKVKHKYEKVFKDIIPWLKRKGADLSLKPLQFVDVVEKYNLYEQKRLGHLADLEALLQGVLEKGGEGLILRNPLSLWTPARVYSLLKYKPFEDSEGTVVGFFWGKKTEEGSKLLGKMGAMIVEWNGKKFKLSGFTDEERIVSCPGKDSYTVGEEFEGQQMTSDWNSASFPIGSSVTFKYRELSDDGVPKEARYLRQRED